MLENDNAVVVVGQTPGDCDLLRIASKRETISLALNSLMPIRNAGLTTDGKLLFIAHISLAQTLASITGLDIESILPRRIPPQDYDIYLNRSILSPFKHQLRTLQFILAHGNSAVFSDQGTGKTKPVIDAIAYWIRSGRIKHALVLCPNCLIYNWLDEVVNNYPGKEVQENCPGGIKCKDGIWHLPSENLKVVVLTGKKRDEDLDRVVQNGVHVAITNYDSMAVKRFCLKTQGVVDNKWALVCDESTRIKVPKANRTQQVLLLAEKTRHNIIVTGTPVTDSLLNIWCQYYLVDYGQAFCRPGKPNKSGERKPWGGYYTYRRKFFAAGYQNWSFTPLRGTEDYVRSALAVRAIRVRVKDCLDIPPKVYTVLRLELSDEQARIYKRLLETLTIELESEGTLTVRNAFARAIKFSEICDGFCYGSEHQVEFIDGSNPKLDAVTSIVQEAPTKVIIWCRFIPSIAIVTKKLRGLDIGVLTFDDEPNPKACEVRFNSDARIKVLVANPARGGIGLNLTSANTAIYYSNTLAGEHRLQSEDRNHRIGSTGDKISYFDLICMKTVEESILKLVDFKRNLSESTVRNVRAFLTGEGGV